mmetsp:Transcript_45850/g.132780  ORF Transcript_45850/g.132780 Transcript_45850/m.132780 type:complete len:278 (+) Transcript_45850:35-868(+)
MTMATSQSNLAARLSEALGVDLETSCAALQSNGGDADAAAASILAAGQQVGPPPISEPPTSALGTLLEMGYPQAEAEDALVTARGDLELALAHLLSGADTQPPNMDGQPSHAEGAAGMAGMEVDTGDCAICCEPLLLTDAAMRCAGRAGCHHYGHAACLAKWVESCRRDGAAPSCPTCRGPLQLHRRRLREFLQQSERGMDSRGVGRGQCQVSQEHSELLHSMLQQESRAEDDSWSDIDFEQIAGFVLAAGALVAFGLAAKAALDHFSRKDESSRRR